MRTIETIIVWSLFLASSVFGHVALKRVAGVSVKFDYARVLAMWKDPWALTAVAAWGVSCFLWALLLTRYGVAEAAGHSSLRYVAMLAAAALLLGETLTTRQLAGAGLIAAGVWLTAKP